MTRKVSGGYGTFLFVDFDMCALKSRRHAGDASDHSGVSVFFAIARF